MDTYTRVVLTVIAAALTVIAFRGVDPISLAHAAEEIECRFNGGVTVSDFRDSLDVDIDDTVTVEVKQAFSQPGSNSSSPLYIQVVD